MSKNGTSDLFALLIGVDYYYPNTLPEGGSYPSLRGCVRDINSCRRFFVTKSSNI